MKRAGLNLNEGRTVARLRQLHERVNAWRGGNGVSGVPLRELRRYALVDATNKGGR
jgi:hypothetical protein